jgi:hypothetical protein
MKRWSLLVVAASALTIAAAPLDREAPTPEPVVFHRFTVQLKLPRRTDRQVGKVLGLDVPLVQVTLVRGQNYPWHPYGIWVRSYESYEKVLARIRRCPDLVGVTVPRRPVPRTYRLLPGR